MKFLRSFIVLLIVCLLLSPALAEAKKRKRKRQYVGPPPTHPVILWAHALNGSDREQRKIAAFKLSQYSQTIYQDLVINSLIRCMKLPPEDFLAFEIKVLCTKAFTKAGKENQKEWIRTTLMNQYHEENKLLGNTIVRTMTKRNDASTLVHDTFLETARNSQDTDELVTLMSYFEALGSGTNAFVDSLVVLYEKHDNLRVKKAIASVLGERGQGQSKATLLLSQCAEHKDTPLALTCVTGLQQARNDPNIWNVVTKLIQVDDQDMLWETLGLILSLPGTRNPVISKRLIEIIDEKEDPDIIERAILSLGVCGDKSDEVVNSLISRLEDKGMDEGVRIAAALVLPKQSLLSVERAKLSLANCIHGASFPTLKNACQLAIQEVTELEKNLSQHKPEDLKRSVSQDPSIDASSQAVVPLASPAAVTMPTSPPVVAGPFPTETPKDTPATPTETPKIEP